MKKFTELNEGKIFISDPSVRKTYAAYIIPVYITGKVKCDSKLIEEWLAHNKPSNRTKGVNYLFDIEILAVKQILDNPTTQVGFEALKKEIDAKCPKLERFLRQHYSVPGNFK